MGTLPFMADGEAARNEGRGEICGGYSSDELAALENWLAETRKLRERLDPTSAWAEAARTICAELSSALPLPSSQPSPISRQHDPT